MGSLVCQVKPDDGPDSVSLLLESPRGKDEISRVERFSLLHLMLAPPRDWVRVAEFKNIKDVFSASDVNSLRKVWGSIQKEFSRRTYAFAPIRTKYYFAREKHGATIYNLELDKDGAPRIRRQATAGSS